MNIEKSKTLTLEQKQRIKTLWNAEYPAAVKYTDMAAFDSYLDGLDAKQHYLLLDEGTLLGWMMTFTRGGERWMAMMIDQTRQKKGMGTMLIEYAKLEEPIINGWVVDHNHDLNGRGEPYQSPLGFYQKRGFKVLDTRWDNEKLKCIKVKWERA